jgi:hypothetical protein
VTAADGFGDFGFALSVESRRKWTRGSRYQRFGRKYGMAYRLGGSPISVLPRFEGHAMDASTRVDQDQKVTLVRYPHEVHRGHERRMVP